MDRNNIKKINKDKSGESYDFDKIIDRSGSGDLKHGTGCTLSSAIAAYLAQGMNLPNAVEKAKEYITMAIAEGADVCIGKGHGPLNHFFNPMKMIKTNQK